FAAVRPALDGPLTLMLDRELICALDCPRCGWHTEILKPRIRVLQSSTLCPNCREPALPEILSAIDERSSLRAQPLLPVGIPPYDIVRIDGGRESGFFLLNADSV